MFASRGRLFGGMFRETFAADLVRHLYAEYGGPVTVSRASTALYLDADGNYREAAIDEPCINSNLGVLCMPQSTNIAPYPVDVTQWTFVGICDAELSGTIAGIAAYQLSGQTANWHRRYFIPAAILSGPQAISLSIAPGNQNNARVNLRDNTTTFATIIDIDASAGTHSVSSELAGTVTVSSTALSDGYRFDMVFVPAVDGNGFSFAVGTGTTEPTDTIRVGLAQVESGSYITPPIKTGGATRLAQYLTVPHLNMPKRGFEVEMEVTPFVDGSDMADADIRLFGTDDLTGANDEVRTAGSSAEYSYAHAAGGGIFAILNTDLVKDTTATWYFALRQEGSNVRAVIRKDGVEKLNSITAGTLDHSDQGFTLGGYGTDVFLGYIKNIRVRPL